MQSLQSRAHVLVVDDSELVCACLRSTLERVGYAVRTAADGPEALGILEREPVDAVLLDLVLPGLGGLEVLERVRRRHPGTAVVMMTGHADLESARHALALGAAEYLAKPASDHDLLGALDTALGAEGQWIVR